ncbi:hypothetical protein, partial [Muricoccus vinaceus]
RRHPRQRRTLLPTNLQLRPLASMEQTFGEDYSSFGMAFVMGTHSRRAEQWLLVGVLRLDPVNQLSLL